MGAQGDEPGITYVIEIHSDIDPGLASFVKRAVDEAESANAQAIILDIETFGGRVDAAVDIRDFIVGTDIQTIAFVTRAISAGALITLSADEIVMVPGSSMGAAEAVSFSPEGMKKLGEKEISYVRTEFRGTAERKGHNGLLAAAMVDSDVALYARDVDGRLEIFSRDTKEGELASESEKGEVVIQEGKLLSVTAEDAMKYGLIEHQATTLDEVLALFDLAKTKVVTPRVLWSEKLVRFLTNPVVTGLLLTFGVLGIISELKMPGWGISGTIGIVCLALFFGAHYLTGLADWAEGVLFLVGVVLLALEIFVIPGFGIVGISGILCMVASIYLSLVREPVPRYQWEMEVFNGAIISIAILSVALLVGLWLFSVAVRKTSYFNWIALKTEERAEAGYDMRSDKRETLAGREGLALSMLRPAGRARFGDTTFDVVTEGAFVDKGDRIKVLKVAGNRIVVEKSNMDEA